MKEILTRNLSLKILSIVIAFFVWLAVVNVSDPQITDRKEITLEVLNGEVMTNAGLSYEIEGKRTTVTVSYLVRTRDRMSVTGSDFRAYIDLADYYPATSTVPVYVEVLNNKDYYIESVAARPAVVRIKTEQIQEKDFDLQIHTQGQVADGYEVENIQLDQDMVTVKGPESVIGRISSVGIEIDLTEGMEGKAAPVFYDANGNDLSLDDRVTVNFPEISYLVKLMKVKQLRLEFEVGGRVAEGFRYVGMEASTDVVSVMGVDTVVSQIDTITIPAEALSLEGAREDRLIAINVEDYLPDKQNMSIPWNSQVTVTLKVRELSTRVMEVPTNRIIREGEESQNYYDYDQDSIQVTVQGLPEDLETLDMTDLILEMDVSGLEVGSYAGQLSFKGLSEELAVVSYSDFQIIISSKDAGPGASSGASSETEGGTEEDREEGEARAAMGSSAAASPFMGETGTGESYSESRSPEGVGPGHPSQPEGIGE